MIVAGDSAAAPKIERLWSRSRVLLRDLHLLKQLPVLKNLLLDASLLLLVAIGALYKHLDPVIVSHSSLLP